MVEDLNNMTITELEEKFGEKKQTDEHKADFIARLRSGDVAQKADFSEVEEKLQELLDFGLEFEVEDDVYTMRYSGREDSGNMAQSSDTIAAAARNLIGAETLERLKEQKKAEEEKADKKKK